MRLYVLELKRLLKTRSVGILIIAALILSAVLSYLPVTYIQAYKTDKSGTIQVVTGIEAIKAKKADKKAADTKWYRPLFILVSALSRLRRPRPVYRVPRSYPACR